MPTAPDSLPTETTVARAPDALDVAADLRVPERQLQAERHRLGVHAVRPADHRRAPMLEGALADRLGQPVEILQDDVARLAHLQRLRGVDDVRRGQAEMQPAGRRTDLLGDRGGEGDDVVLGGLFDFFDAGDVEGAALADVARGLGRNDAGGRHRFGGRRFDEQPGLVAALVAPDAPHLRVRVAWIISYSVTAKDTKDTKANPFELELSSCPGVW